MLLHSERTKAVFVFFLTLPALLSCRIAEAHHSPPPFAVTTPHYTVETDTGEEFASLAARQMDAMYGEYERQFSEHIMQPGHRATIRIFARRSCYTAAVPRPLRETAGCFIGEQNLIMSFLGERSHQDVLRTLYHEGFHQFLYDRVGKDMPLWLNEGLAEYFAEAIWNGDGFILGRKPVERLHRLQSALGSNTLIPLPRLVRMENSRWMAAVRRDASLADLQYSQAWSVVHFLLHSREGRYKDRLSHYLRAHQEGREPSAAFKESFGSNLRAMERAWKKYIKDLEPDPLSLCLHNMELLISLADTVYDEPCEMKDANEFVERLLASGRRKWGLTNRYGPDLTDQDTGILREMLSCAAHDGEAETGYILENEPETGLPRLYCFDHEGLMIRAYLLRRDARWRPQTEIVPGKPGAPAPQ